MVDDCKSRFFFERFGKSSWDRRVAFRVPPSDGLRHGPPEGGTPYRGFQYTL
jgi:hypothetical protein